MLLGLWKNFEELEANLNLNELEAILNAAHEQEHRHNKFTAALKGINLDEAQVEENKNRFEEIKRRVEARRSGKSEDELAFNALGIDVEIE